MGARQTRSNINQGEYEDRFKKISQQCQDGPEDDRECNDVCCLVTFLLLTALFIAVGIFFIIRFQREDLDKMTMENFGYLGGDENSSRRHQFKQSAHHNEVLHMKMGANNLQRQTHNPAQFNSNYDTMEMPNLKPMIPYAIFMALLSLVLSIVIVILVSKYPKPTIYGMVALTSILLILGLVYSIVNDRVELIVVIIIFTIIWSILLCSMFCCMREQLDSAVVLLKVSGNFIKHKPSVLLAPIIMMIVTLLFFSFWAFSFLTIQLDRPFEQYAQQKSNTPQGQVYERQKTIHDLWTVLWFFFSYFYGYFLYYIMVFLIATATGLWYYGIDANYIITGFKYIVQSHIGSFTFASLLIAIVSFMKNATEDGRGQSNPCSMVCRCLVRCCLSILEQIIKVLNHNSIIVMSVTGQAYIEAAKSTIYLIFKSFGLFIAIQILDVLIGFCVLFFVTIIPTVLGGYLLSKTYDQGPDGEEYYLLIGTAIIFVVCLLIGMLVITILTQVLACIFIFFCLDKKFQEFNYGVVNRVPPELRELFGQIQHQERQGDFNRFVNLPNQGQNNEGMYNNNINYNPNNYPNNNNYAPVNNNQRY